MYWIDYKKAFDSVPHSWILAVLTLYKVAPTIVSSFSKVYDCMENCPQAGSSVIGTVSIRSGIFQEDVISPLLFCIGSTEFFT